ncbi:MAG: NAD(P)-dependent oxidoreductase [Chloroflexi bacterium]|nr:NAD(P)-dependent oxidoreductase [Chloroflexota bacterium]
MKVLVTGGSGFIGTNLIEYYLSKEVEVINLDIAPPKNLEHKSYWKKVDILDSEGLHAEIVNFSPSHIVNLAAHTGTTDRGKTLEQYAANFQGVRNLIEVARELPSLERIIFTSSMLVCRSGYQPRSETDYCPDTLYGQSKMLGETIIRQGGELPFSWAIVRPIGIWGPWFGVPYKDLFKAIQRGLYVHSTGANVYQSLGFVGNTVHQLDKLIQAPSHKIHGKTFYLADYPPINIRAWTDLIQKAFRARRIHEIPIWTLKVVAAVGDTMKLVGWDNPPLSSSRLKNMLTSFVFDLAPIITENLPYTLEEAVQITVNWMCKNKS